MDLIHGNGLVVYSAVAMYWWFRSALYTANGEGYGDAYYKDKCFIEANINAKPTYAYAAGDTNMPIYYYGELV